MRRVGILIALLLIFVSCKKTERLTSPDHYIIKKSITERVSLSNPAEFRLEIIPTDGYEMEAEAPIKLKFNKELSPDVEFEKEIYTKEDLLNRDIKRPVFSGRITPKKKGEFKIAADLSFVVCTSSVCEPKKTEVIFEFVAE
jgi:hypothetical protein